MWKVKKHGGARFKQKDSVANQVPLPKLKQIKKLHFDIG
jgi:hypothetical protein